MEVSHGSPNLMELKDFTRHTRIYGRHDRAIRSFTGMSIKEEKMISVEIAGFRLFSNKR